MPTFTLPAAKYPGGRPWQPDEIRQLRALVEARLPTREIAAILQRTVKSVHYRCRIQGFARRPDKWTPAENRTLRQLAGTASAAEIGARLGRTAEAVRSHAVTLGIALQRRGERHQTARIPDALVEHLRTAHEHGTTPTHLARETGIHLATVKSIVYYQKRAV